MSEELFHQNAVARADADEHLLRYIGDGESSQGPFSEQQILLLKAMLVDAYVAGARHGALIQKIAKEINDKSE